MQKKFNLQNQLYIFGKIKLPKKKWFLRKLINKHFLTGYRKKFSPFNFGNPKHSFSTCKKFWAPNMSIYEPTCFLVVSFYYFLEFFKRKNIQCKMCFISDNLLLLQNEKDYKKHISMIHFKKNIISETNSELVKKKFSQNLKCIDVSSEDKSIQFDDMKMVPTWNC